MGKTKYTVKDNPQGSEEWLQDRLGHFTGSNAQAVASSGAGLTTAVFEKVAEILTGKAKEAYSNADMERGNELEAMARNSYELESGNTVKEVGFVEMDESTGCSPDGFIGKDGLVEIKCPNDTNFAKYLFYKKIDSAHDWQMQMQMFVTDGKQWEYVVFNPNFPNTTIIVRIERDEDKIKKIEEGLKIGKEKIEEILKKIK